MSKIPTFIILLITGSIITSPHIELTDATLIHASFRRVSKVSIQVILIKAVIENSEDSLQYNLFKKLQFSHIQFKIKKDYPDFDGTIIQNNEILGLFNKNLPSAMKRLNPLNALEIRPLVYSFAYSDDADKNKTQQGKFESDFFGKFNFGNDQLDGVLELIGNHFTYDNDNRFMSVDGKEKKTSRSLKIFVETEKSSKDTKDGKAKYLNVKPVSISILDNNLKPLENSTEFLQMNFAYYDGELFRNNVTRLESAEEITDIPGLESVFNTISSESETFDDAKEKENTQKIIDTIYNTENNGPTTPRRTKQNSFSTFFVQKGFLRLLETFFKDEITFSAELDKMIRPDLISLESATFSYLNNDTLEKAGLGNVESIKVELKKSFEDRPLITNPMLFKNTHTATEVPAVPVVPDTPKSPTNHPQTSKKSNIGSLGITLIIIIAIVVVGAIAMVGVYFIKSSKQTQRYKHRAVQ